MSRAGWCVETRRGVSPEGRGVSGLCVCVFAWMCVCASVCPGRRELKPSVSAQQCDLTLVRAALVELVVGKSSAMS